MLCYCILLEQKQKIAIYPSIPHLGGPFGDLFVIPERTKADPPRQ